MGAGNERQFRAADENGLWLEEPVALFPSLPATLYHLISVREELIVAVQGRPARKGGQTLSIVLKQFAPVRHPALFPIPKSMCRNEEILQN